jgi:hypothetical protein
LTKLKTFPDPAGEILIAAYLPSASSSCSRGSAASPSPATARAEGQSGRRSHTRSRVTTCLYVSVCTRTRYVGGVHAVRACTAGGDSCARAGVRVRRGLFGVTPELALGEMSRLLASLATMAHRSIRPSSQVSSRRASRLVAGMGELSCNCNPPTPRLPAHGPRHGTAWHGVPLRCQNCLCAGG